MQHKTGLLASFAVVLAMALSLATGIAIAQQVAPEAPFGDRVSGRIPYYHRAAPTIATAGTLGRLGVIEAKAVGFRSILNLGPSTSAAGLDDASLANYALLQYFSVPASEPPTREQIDEVRRILDAVENGPILIYGIDEDQAAAVWALVRAAAGVPPELALQEGLTAGLRKRLPAVREGLAPPQPSR